MGFFRDFRNEVEEARYHIVDEILMEKPEWHGHRKEDVRPEPGACKKLSAALVSGIYATRNIQRAQWGVTPPGDAMGKRTFGPHGAGDGCDTISCPP